MTVLATNLNLWAMASCTYNTLMAIDAKWRKSSLLAVYYALRHVCGKLITTVTQLLLPVALIVIKWVGLNDLGT